MIVTAIKTEKPKTRWNYSVYAIRNERGEKIDRCLVSAGGDSLEDTIRRMMADVVHYIGCGYKVEIRDVTETCVKCDGEGSIRKRRGNLYSDQTVKCKACKGIGGFAKLGTIEQPEFSHGLTINL